MIAQANDLPGPGFYQDIPFATYLSWPYVSNSALSVVKRSPAHYHARLPSEETPAFRLGSLCHTGVLEPASVSTRYCVMPDLTQGILREDGTPYDKPTATKEYGKRVAAYQAMAKERGQVVVDHENFSQMMGVVRAICEHEIARDYLCGDGYVELSMVWDDPETGLRCKGRIDKFKPHQKRISDLKTTRDGSRFENSIFQYGYYRQGAFYRRGVKAIAGIDCEFCIAAIETDEPYAVRAAPLGNDALELGEVMR